MIISDIPHFLIFVFNFSRMKYFGIYLEDLSFIQEMETDPTYVQHIQIQEEG